VLSARYGSTDGSTPLAAPERNALLLEEMRGVADRACRFVCCMSLVLSPDRIFVVQETCEGLLLEAPRGSGGFGYDPLVYLPELGCSVAELSTEQKNRVSHRGRALSRMAAIIDSLSGMA
jgi:XTP/dITP diphosphohydrolase